MDKSITKKMINNYQEECNSNVKLKLSRNAATHNEITDLAMDWDEFRKIDHSFSETISGEMKITNQKSSGRCWGFAGLNLFRVYLGRKHNIRNFEFSQTYFMFGLGLIIGEHRRRNNQFLSTLMKLNDYLISSNQRKNEPETRKELFNLLLINEMALVRELAKSRGVTIGE